MENSNGNTINVIEFTTYPASGYTFYTRDTNDIDTEIPASSLVVPPRIVGDGSEGNPYLATDGDDTIAGATGADWVSYAGSTDTRGIRVNLRTDPADVYNGATGDTLTGINNIIGSDHGDFLIGNSGDNILRGGAGYDILRGHEGADTLDGGAGVDTAYYDFSGKGVRVSLLLQGQAQQDFEANSYGFTANGNEAVGDILSNIEEIIGSARYADWLTGDGNENFLRGWGGDDRLEGGAGADTYQFQVGDGTDTIVDDGGKIVFLQGTGNDYAGATYTFTRADGGRSEAVTLTVTKGGNTLNIIEFTTYPASGYTFYTRDTVGSDTDITATLPAVPARQDGSESNPFLATAGADTFTGSDGADWVSYAGATSNVAIDLSTTPATVSRGATGDTLTGINNLIGSDHDDRLVGNSGDNTLHGGADNDYLHGGVGADILDGGAGEDTAAYGSSAKGVRVNLLLQGQAQIDFDGSHGFTANGNEAVGDILSNIEEIIGSHDNNDWLTGDGNDNTFRAGRGNDRLEGGAGADTYQFFLGDGTDTIVDDGGSIIFLPGGGNDYAGATYTFTRPDPAGDAVTLTVSDSGGNTINVIKFSDDSSGYSFYTRSRGIDTEITTTLPAVPPRQDGSESNPFLATDAADTFTGSAGADWVSYAGSTDTNGVRVDLSTDPVTVSGGAAGDTLSGINNLIGSDYGDILTGNDVDSILRGGAGDDYVYGEGGTDTLYGSEGDDTIGGGEGADIIDGGADTDIAVYGGAGEGVRVSLLLQGQPQQDFDGTRGFTANDNDAVGDILTNIENIGGSNYNDWLTGDDNANEIQGGDGNDRLEGGAGDDHLYGNRGNDNLYGEAGNDELYGGDGEDTYEFDADGGTDTVNDDGGKIVFKQGTGNDYVGATYAFARVDEGRSPAVILTVKDSNDITINVIEFTTDPSSSYTFYTRDTNGVDTDITATLPAVPLGVAGTESNPFSATDAADTFTGSAGADWISYAGSTDTTGVRVILKTDPAAVSRGATGDTISGINHLIGSDYGDILTGNDDASILRGGAGDDYVYGEGGTDTLYGSEGDDTIGGGEGADIIDGGADTDIATYGGAGEGVRVSLLLQGQQQQDFDGTHGFQANDNDAEGDILTNIENIEGSNYNDWLTGDDNDNTLIGEGGDDRLEGGEGDDTLRGGEGSDTLIGGEGDDTLRGGEGSDTLIGGDGVDIDTYIFGSNDGTDKDTIIDGGYISLVFLQGTGNDYAGATYSFAPADAGLGEAVTLTVSKDGNTLNVIEFATYDPSPYVYTFYTGLLGGEGNDRIEGGDGNDWIDGGEGYDYLYGGEGYDYLNGGDGNDHLYGHEGNDILDGGEGRDYLYGGEGTDVIDGGDGNDYLHGDDGLDWLYGGEGNDELYGDAGNDYLYGNEGNDYLYGGEGDDDLFGHAGNDYLYGGEGYDDLFGHDGNDELYGGEGDDDLYGYEGNDILYGGEDDDDLYGDEGNDYLYGNEGDDRLYGFYGNDDLRGHEGNDILYGHEGNDILDGGEGNDILYGDHTLYGSDGADTYIFESGDGTDTIVDNGGNILFQQGLNDDYEGATYSFSYVNGKIRLTVVKDGNTLNVIEFSSDPSRYTFYTGSVSPDDEISASSLVFPLGSGGNPYLATEAADTFTSSDDANWVSYAESTDTAGVSIDLSTNPATASRGAAGDTLSGINKLFGSNYGDDLTGNDNANTLRGGSGNDWLYGEEGNDYLYGEEGNDYLYGEEGNDYLYGEEGNDYLYGEEGKDRLYGGEGNDRIEGGDESDVIRGGDGHDSLYGGDGNDYLYGGEGNDDLYSGEGGGILRGGEGNDHLEGGEGNDRIEGGEGDDDLYGGKGYDHLYGDRGSDLLQGGQGEDKYYFDAYDGVGTYGVDVIRSNGDETGNSVVFRAPSGVTYTDSNFYFARGNMNYNEVTRDPDFTGSQTGDDLQIVTHDRGSGDDRVHWNSVYIEDYFNQPDDAYTIYGVSYGLSFFDVFSIISTAPDETS